MSKRRPYIKCPKGYVMYLYDDCAIAKSPDKDKPDMEYDYEKRDWKQKD